MKDLTIMVAKYLHARLRVGIVSGLEAQPIHSKLGKERIQNTNKIAQSQIVISNKTFNLMKLGKMSGIHRFISEDFVYGKVPDWLELLQ